MPNKTFVFILVFLLAAAVGAAPLAQTVDVVVTSNVNLREGPGTEFSIITTLQQGEIVRVDGRSEATALWVHIVTGDGLAGWTFSQHLAAPMDVLAALPVMTGNPGGAPPPAPAQPAPADSAAQPALPAPEAGAPAQAAPAQPAAPPTSGIVSGVSGNARAIYERGQALGNNPNVFSKVGDSITATAWFLEPIGWGRYNLADHTYLQPVIDYFMAGTSRTGNSFANASLAATAGWTSAHVLDPAAAIPGACQPTESPLVCEYRVSRPAVALIMLGTNDLSYIPLETYRANLSAIVQTSIDMGVIPVISTIPTRAGFEQTVPLFNQVVLETARYYDVPVWDYEIAIRGLPNQGLGDGIHPSTPPGTHEYDFPAAVDFSPFNMQFGFTVRNLTALQALDAVWRGAMY
jgi:uncharacterized protein YraI